jgi:LysM repeat protein
MYENTKKSPTKKFALFGLSILMVMALLAVSLPLQKASAQTTCSTYHTVVSGETLSSIATQYNTTVAAIAEANDLKEPYVIFVGQRLCIPGSAVAPTATGTSGTTTPTGPTIKVESLPGFYWVTVGISGFPAKTSYYVRLTNGPTGMNNPIKLGTVRTDKAGAATRTFIVPRSYWETDFARVCVKNPLTDQVYCVNFYPELP